MLANGIANGGVISIQSLQAVGRQVIEILVEEGHIFVGLPLSTVSPPQTIHTGGVDDLVVNTQREGDEGTGLDELAIPQLSLTDVLQKDFVQMIEAIGRGNGGDVDLLTAVVDAVFAIHLGTADPGDEADGEGDDVVELVLLLNLMNHPIEPSLTVDGTDEDLLLALVDERGKFLESIAVLVYGHAQEYDISIGDDVLVVIAEGVDISVEFLQTVFWAMGSTREQQIAYVSGLSTHTLEVILEKIKFYGNWARSIGCELCNDFGSTLSRAN